MKLVRRAFSATSAAVVGLSSLMTIGFTGVAGAAGLNCTWTGATNDNFNTAGNWSNCSSGVPGTGDNLVFDVTSLSATKTLTNDISGLSVATVTFQGTNGNGYRYALAGNSITVTSGLTTGSGSVVISNPLVFSGTVALNLGGYTSFGGAVSGNATLTKTGAGALYFTTDGSLSGSLTANAGSVIAGTASSLGSAALTINDGADIQIGDCSGSGFTFANDLILQGASSSPSGQYPTPKLMTFAGSCSGGGGSYSESYGQATTTDDSFTLSGTMALSSDATFGSRAKTTNVTGTMLGSGKFTLLSTYSGKLVVNSDTNNSGMANGTYTPDPVVVTLSDSQPTNTLAVGSGAVVIVDGTRGNTDVQAGGTLKGNGTVGTLDVSGTVAPGHSPGCITSSGLTMSGTYQAEIGGNDACTGYDQLKVNGTVTLNNATLDTSLYNGFLPAKGAKYTIIDNDGTDAVTGTFAGLAEGATFKVSDGVFSISYVGGDGNDVVITVVTAPTTPDTGFALIAANPLMTLGVTSAAAATIFGIARMNSRRKLAPARAKSSRR